MMRDRVFRIAGVILSLFLVPSTGSAQQTPAPSAVNDCTLLTDPTELRECLEGRAGLDSRFVPVGPKRRDNKEPLLEDKDKGALEEKVGPPP